jgi:hypothetical protein
MKGNAPTEKKPIIDFGMTLKKESEEKGTPIGTNGISNRA